MGPVVRPWLFLHPGMTGFIRSFSLVVSCTITRTKWFRLAGGARRLLHFRTPVLGSSSSSLVQMGVESDSRHEGDYQDDSDDQRRPFFKIFYNDVYRVSLPANHRFPMEKYRLVREKLQSTIESEVATHGSLVQCDFQVSPLATISELAWTHDVQYIQRFLEGRQTEAELRNVGFPWSEAGVIRSRSSTGGTIAAACAAVEEWIQRTEHLPATQQQEANLPCWSGHVAGGTHHAFFDYGEGFCIFSDIAVAANVLRQKYPDRIRNILILDLDVHQGNGNAVLFQGRPDVFTFSMHCAANYFSKRQESDLDIELPAGCTDATYLLTLHHWLKHLKTVRKFDVAFFQAGVDVLECDRLGKFDLTSRGVERRNQLVYEFAYEMNVPLIITMGGGYPSGRDNDAWTPIVDAHVNVYLQAYQFLANKVKMQRTSQVAMS